MYVSVKESLTTYTQSGSFIFLMPGEDVVTFFLLLFFGQIIVLDRYVFHFLIKPRIVDKETINVTNISY
jgi:hypothetical protein